MSQKSRFICLMGAACAIFSLIGGGGGVGVGIALSRNGEDSPQQSLNPTSTPSASPMSVPSSSPCRACLPDYPPLMSIYKTGMFRPSRVWS